MAKVGWISAEITVSIPRGESLSLCRVVWSGKRVITFSDALTTVRRWLCANGLFQRRARPGLWRNSPSRYLRYCSTPWSRWCSLAPTAPVKLRDFRGKAPPLSSPARVLPRSTRVLDLTTVLIVDTLIM